MNSSLSFFSAASERSLARSVVTALVLGASMFATQAHSAESSDLRKALEAAMSSETRSDSDKARDKNRKPIETLEFFQLEDDMRVVELLPGGGWYTSLLAPALRERGELFVAIGTGRVEQQLLKQPGFDKVGVLAQNTKIERGDNGYTMASLNLGVKRADLVLTFRNLHNFDAPSRKLMNKAVFTSLKRGGMYGVVDHTRRHMQGDDSENGRRMDPVLAIKEIQEAGFELVDFSDLHYRLDDELRYEVGRRSVSGNTDRFTLLFKKP